MPLFASLLNVLVGDGDIGEVGLLPRRPARLVVQAELVVIEMAVGDGSAGDTLPLMLDGGTRWCSAHRHVVQHQVRNVAGIVNFKTVGRGRAHQRKHHSGVTCENRAVGGDIHRSRRRWVHAQAFAGRHADPPPPRWAPLAESVMAGLLGAAGVDDRVRRAAAAGRRQSPAPACSG